MARRKPTTETRVSVKPIPLESPRLLMFGEESKLWTDGSFGEEIAGTYVLLRPPHEFPDAEKVKESFLKKGARAVRVEKAKAAAPLVAQGKARVKSKGIRQVVLSLVNEYPGGDKVKLRAIIEGVLAEVGL